jgi:hypothetical protein
MESAIRLFVAFLLPWLTFFTVGRPIAGVVCLLLQLTLIANLYPLDRRAGRFWRILQVLDGAVAGLRQREIASVVFGSERVNREWQVESHLRDHIRRTIAQGRQLVKCGNRRLLA